MERYCGLGHEEFPGRGLSYDTGCPFAPQRSSFYLGSSTEGIRRICCHPICFSWKKLLYLALPMAFLCRTQLLQCMYVSNQMCFIVYGSLLFFRNDFSHFSQMHQYPPMYHLLRIPRLLFQRLSSSFPSKMPARFQNQLPPRLSCLG